MRFYGGEKLGMKRFELIKQAARYAIEQVPDLEKEQRKSNTVKDQTPTDQIQDQTVAKNKYLFTQTGTDSTTSVVTKDYTYKEALTTGQAREEQRNTARKIKLHTCSRTKEKTLIKV